MEELKNRIHANFCRHIARALGAMEIGSASTEMKAAVKSEFWNIFDDVTSFIKQSKESKEEERHEHEKSPNDRG